MVYIGQRGDNLADVANEESSFDKTYLVSAGKFRRYHGAGFSQFLDIKTVLLNFRDLFRALTGCIQAYYILGREKPAAIFVKGGFVGVPVGLAAAKRKIPFVTHDSDVIPGLANKIISRWATKHAVALPTEMYPYPPNKTVTVGVPVRPEFAAVDGTKLTEYKRSLKLGEQGRVLFVTGGGLGAQRLNTAVAAISGQLLQDFPDLHIIHTTGRGNEAATLDLYAKTLTDEQQSRVVLVGFATDLYRYSGAADLVIMRAGATAIAEVALQKKAVILVPNPHLTGGHQLKNAEVLQDAGAAAIFSDKALESDLPLLIATISGLLQDAGARQRLAASLHKFARPKATEDLANLILNVAADSRN